MNNDELNKIAELKEKVLLLRKDIEKHNSARKKLAKRKKELLAEIDKLEAETNVK